MQTIPIYIINLKSRPERRLYIQRQLDRFGLQYQFVAAVDTTDQQDLSDYQLENDMTAGTLGCLLSHLKCYELIIKNKNPLACILEDDGELLDTFPAVLNAALLSEKDWGVLLLAHQGVTTGRLLSIHYDIGRNAYKYRLGALPRRACEPLCEGHAIGTPKLARPHDHPRSTMGYLLTLSAAETLQKVASINKHYLHIDDIVGCDIFGTAPKILTPPCIHLNLTYLWYSSVAALDERGACADLPNKKLWLRFLTRRWSTTLALLLNQLLFRRRKGMKKSLHALTYLAYIEWESAIARILPSKRYLRRVLDAEKRVRQSTR